MDNHWPSVYRIPGSAGIVKPGSHCAAKAPQSEAKNYNATAQSDYWFLSLTVSNLQNIAVKS